MDKQTEINTAERQLPEPSVFEVEMAIENLKTRKSSVSAKIAGEFIKAEVEQFFRRSITY
jgi:hypothetical protein